MLASVRLAATRLPASRLSMAPRACLATRHFTLEKEIKSKEKVEEDRYIRAKEAADLEKKRKSKAREECAVTAAAYDAEADAEHDALISSTTHELSDILASSGDHISAEGILAIAKWKLGE